MSVDVTVSAPAPSQDTARTPGRGIVALIDGHYYAFRYFFGMPPLKGPNGHPTGVTYAFANLFRDLRASPEITHWACVFDARAPDFRSKLYPDYKAHRDPMPETLATQLPDLAVIARASGVPVIEAPGYEADDVLATLALTAAAAGHDVRLLTKDKDVDQVLSDRIRTWDPGKNLLRGPAELLAEKGIRPDQVIDYLCMIGDTSDNVPGIDGVGPKNAAKLLSTYGSLASVLAHAGELKGKQRENVIAFQPKAELTRTLITLVQVPDLPGLDALRIDRETPIDTSVHARFGFSSFARGAQAAARSRGVPPPAAVLKSASTGALVRIAAQADLPGIVAACRTAGRFAVDTETTSLDPHTADLVGISLACGDAGPASAWYLPLRGLGHALLDAPTVQRLLAPLLADAHVGKIGQNLKFDQRVLTRQGMPVVGYDGDTMLASWLLDPSRENHGIDALAETFLGETKIATTQVVDLAAGQTMADVDVARVAAYACEDAQVCWRLASVLEARLAEAGLIEVYRGQEVPIATCLAHMEDAGIAVDRGVLAAGQRHLEAYLDQVNAAIRAQAGPDFNPASPKQIAALLFDTLKLPVISRTKSGPSTDAEVLEALRRHHELPDLLLQHRKLSKLIGTYLARLPEFIAADGRIRSNFRQTGAETGRLASDQPNLQNIPKPAEHGREIRAAFTAGPGQVLIAADYSQIELRVLAHLSRDATLCAAFASGADIHRFAAARAFGVAEELVAPDQRQAAKAINFGIIYGQTAFGLAQQLGIAKGQAQRFIDEYFARFSGVKDYIDRTVAETAARGYACTMAGRRRYVPTLTSDNRNERLAGARIALNSTIQGSAADLIKRAMLAVDAALPPAAPGARLILQIHDELIVEAPEAVAPAAAAALTTAMRGAFALDVPLVAEARTGRSWLDVS